MKRIVILTYLCVFVLSQDSEVKRCAEKVGDFSFSRVFPKNREHILDFCMEQAGNTCCLLRDIDKIKSRVDFISSQE